MRIGILTFHCAHNYGAVLQCYALQAYLKSLGHDVVVIDYRPEYLKAPYAVLPKLRNKKLAVKIKTLIVYSLTFYVRLRRYYKFSKFINRELQLSEPIKDKSDIENCNCDLYIIGSDQVWNPKITDGFDDFYFGYFKTSSKIITYAVSLGMSSLTEPQKKYLERALSNFEAISVRESNMIDLLHPLTDKKIQQVIDPTMLLNVSIWQNMVSLKPVERQKYVLVYQVAQNSSVYRIAKHIAEQLGAKVVEIAAWHSCRFRKGYKQTLGPKCFLSYFSQAECVVTSSFHGAVFSLIFERPFYVVDISSMHSGANERLKSILELLQLKDRYIPETWAEKYHEINYKKIRTLRKEYMAEAEEFLQDALQCDSIGQ